MGVGEEEKVVDEVELGGAPGISCTGWRCQRRRAAVHTTPAAVWRAKRRMLYDETMRGE